MRLKPLEALSIPGHMSRPELEWLIGTAATVRSWTEIGGFIGRSMLAVGLALPQGGRLQVVDNRLGDYQRAGQTIWTTYRQLTEQRPDLEVVMCRSDSVASARILRGTDVVFVDGCHSYAQVALDIEAWRARCTLMCGHDFDYPGVKAAVELKLPGAVKASGSIWVSQKPVRA